MLLIALAVYAGAFYIIHLKSLESKLVVLGELSWQIYLSLINMALFRKVTSIDWLYSEYQSLYLCVCVKISQVYQD